MDGAIKDFRSFRADRELLAKMEFEKLPVVDGKRYDLTAPGVRAALGRWKVLKGIPVMMPLSDDERTEFELWLTAERLEHKEKSP